jgi:hypothetical protein
VENKEQAAEHKAATGAISSDTNKEDENSQIASVAAFSPIYD